MEISGKTVVGSRVLDALISLILLASYLLQCNANIES